jgi:hypothetical protein
VVATLAMIRRPKRLRGKVLWRLRDSGVLGLAEPEIQCKAIIGARVMVDHVYHRLEHGRLADAR